MQNWQKDRNYRKHKNANGFFIYVITVDDKDVEVQEEVYKAYSQADRRERYQTERDAGRLLSLERMSEDDMLLSYLTDRHVESAEDAALREMLYQHVQSAIALLKPEEQELVYAVVIGNVTEQGFADTIGVSQVAVHKRKKRILKKIAKLMVINPTDFWEGQ